ncbi:MAG TPA: c-type cytochrome [Steroidobacteraceae bacterium]|nr:c-type cytochrome [Steroidobacteraceae bacterium]
MTIAHDKKFFDTFMLVLGILIGIAVILYVLARIVAKDTQVAEVQASPEMRRAINERIAPVAKVAVTGQDNSALAPPKPAATAAQDLPGEEVFKQTCQACHGAGVAGAPKYGDAAAWAPRIAKGADTLHKHAIEGFQGQAGFMPAKGGATNLSDKSIIAAVDYIISGSKK